MKKFKVGDIIKHKAIIMGYGDLLFLVLHAYTGGRIECLTIASKFGSELYTTRILDSENKELVLRV